METAEGWYGPNSQKCRFTGYGTIISEALCRTAEAYVALLQSDVTRKNPLCIF